MSARRGALVAVASGFVFAAATPPIDVQVGIVIGLVGLALALHASDVRGGAKRGFLFGLAANVLALRFVPDVIARFTPLPFALGCVALVLLAAMQALPWAVCGAVARWAELSPRTQLPGWLAFALGVYTAGFVPAIFPWTPAGGLARWPVFLQTAELVGERGTSFLVAAACALGAAAALALARGDRRRALLDAGFAAMLVALLGTYGVLRLRAIDRARASAPHARVALLEPDFDPVFHWEARRASAMLERLTELTMRAEREGASLTVWPESAYPYTLSHGATASPRGARAVLQHGVRGPVLTGVYMAKPNGNGANSAILVMPDGTIGPSYDKRHLLWFGETVPLGDVFPILRRIFARGTGLEPGTGSVRFVVGPPYPDPTKTWGPIAASVLNCYEDTLPAAGREAMELAPNLLVNVTNDAWFSGSAEGELHLRLAVLRAIETRRDLLRAVNRGPTAWIDAAGRIVARRETSPGAGPGDPLLADAALLDDPPTPYVRAGDVPVGSLLAVLLVVRAIVLSRRLRRRRAGT